MLAVPASPDLALPPEDDFASDELEAEPAPMSAPMKAAPITAPAGPLIDLGQGPTSIDWLVWLTLVVLAGAGAVVGYVVLPGLRWRWF